MVRDRLAGLAAGFSRLSAKFTTLFMVMALLVAATGTFGIRKIAEVGAGVEEMMKSRAAQEKMAVLMKTTVQETRVHLLEAALVFTGTDDFDFSKDDYEMSRDRFRGYVTLLLKGNEKVGIAAAPAGSTLEQRVNAVNAAWRDFEAVGERLLARKSELLQAAGQGGRGPAADTVADEALDALIRQELYGRSEKVQAALDELLVTVGNLMNETRGEVAALQRRARIALLAVIAAAIVLALLLGLVATRRIVIRPILEMKVAAERIAGGDLTCALEVRGRDEIASLAGAVNGMSANLKEMFLKIREVTASLSRATGNIVASSAQVLAAADTQQGVISGTAGPIAELDGSTVEVAESADRLSRSAGETSQVIAKTRVAIERVAENSDVLDSSTQEASSAIQEMLAGIAEISRGLDVLTSSSEQIASSVTQVAASTREIENHSRESVGYADQVLADATGAGTAAARAGTEGIEQIRAKVGDLVSVVQGLGKKSEDIGAILTIIDDIADRTNLLALNAAILSAQAGAHGRGFAVVAGEIKRLAEKTSESVKSIGALISSVQEETRASVQKAHAGLQSVDEGMRLVRGVEEALTGIAGSSGASVDMARAIQRSTAEETRAVRQIEVSIKQMVAQVEHIAGALQEQSKGSSFVLAHTEKLVSVSRSVRGATGEQRDGSVRMVGAVEGIAAQAATIARSTALQRQRSADIVRSMDRIQETTGNLVLSASGMKATIDDLSAAAANLQAELDRFKV